MARVYKWLDYQSEPVAECECGSIVFYILVNGFGDKWDKVEGTECAECGNQIKWVKATHADNKP